MLISKPVFLIFPEPISQHFVGVAYNEESVRVDVLHRGFDGGDLPLLESTHKYLFFRAGVSSLTVENGHTPV